MTIAQKRDVFAVPGMPRMSELPNNLIKQGAVPVTCAEDILAHYGKITVKLPQNIGTTGEQFKNQLDFLQSHIYNLLLKGDISVENIAADAQAPQSEINAALTMMEMSGLIKRLPGGKYGI
jgi:DNA processing protein